MSIGEFKISETFPKLEKPHAVAILRPYLNAKDVGTMVFERLKSEFNTKQIGELKEPGKFYDFVRYRPTTYLKDNERKMEIPNTKIFWAKRDHDHDFLFFNILEPHLHGEQYVNSVIKLLDEFNVEKYCLLGSMLDAVPHTKPLIVSGNVTDSMLKEKNLSIQRSNYEGPSSIVFTINLRAEAELEIKSMYFLVSVPQYLQYFQLENGFIPGKIRIMEIFDFLYNIPVMEMERKLAEKQIEEIDKNMENNPQLEKMLHYFEKLYQKKKKEITLSSEIESTLEEMERKWEGNDFFKD